LVSGGVDSSVALKLLQDEGYDVTAFYLKIWLEDEAAFLGTCPWEDDLKYVRAVCDQLCVPLEIVPLQKEYHDRVVSYALAEVKAGRTPNPDVLCNQQVKFGAFFDAIDESFDKVATGHYAQVESRIRIAEHGSKNPEEIWYLKKAPDPIKDQTYFLTLLDQRQLSRTLFPIGKYTKAQVRELAEKFDLPTKDRKDSQGLCFLGEINYEDFVKFHLGVQEGNIVSDEGRVLGQHRGYWFYTIGQRHGLELPGGPWYVVGKDTKKNIVYVSHHEKVVQQERTSFDVDNFHWISPEEPGSQSKGQLSVKIRHGSRAIPCEISIGTDGSTLHIDMMGKKDRGIAPGQFAVLYHGDICLGGGTIQ
jgi:tRNA-specific 2-thiouridylase